MEYASTLVPDLAMSILAVYNCTQHEAPLAYSLGNCLFLEIAQAFTIHHGENRLRVQACVFATPPTQGMDQIS